MSFLKITDPIKRDQTVKEYLELKKNIRDNLLAERTGEQQLQTELTKFYRPITESQKATKKEITESQKATAREITEGLKPIREGIEKLPKAKKEESADEAWERIYKELKEREEKEQEKKEKEELEEEDDESIGEIAYKALSKPFRDTTFGVRKKGGRHFIGEEHIIIDNNDIILTKEGQRFQGTPGLWELITSKTPKNFTDKDYGEYKGIMLLTGALHRDYNPYRPYPRGSKSDKWNRFLSPIWHKGRFAEWQKEGYEGEGVVIMSSDPNALLKRLDLLLASQKAGHTGVVNELVSICDELKRQKVLNTESYKKLNSIIENDST